MGLPTSKYCKCGKRSKETFLLLLLIEELVPVLVGAEYSGELFWLAGALRQERTIGECCCSEPDADGAQKLKLLLLLEDWLMSIAEHKE